ncbi:MAG: proline--tRNA ligase, partial [Candidatus Thermoplasmatota archaeon]
MDIEIPLENKKEESLTDWYNEVIEKAELCDKRYPIKGMNVWYSYGLAIMKNIDALLRKEVEEMGYQEVQFPVLIPKNEFMKEAEHIKGFENYVYWVTHAGKNELDIPLALRPTSETAMYPIFSLWVRSHSDLPLRVYQIAEVFRYETKQTRAFMRVREIHFFEAHTCHTDFEDAEKQVEEDLKIMEKFSKALSIPYLQCKRPEWDKFAGAFYSIGLDAVMPNKKTNQIGSIHHYKDNFSRPYNIKYEDLDGKQKYVHQTTYGMSERLLGAIIGIHGDNRGLVLPPKIAPYQIVIVPVLLKSHKKEIEKRAKELLNRLLELGFRVKLDERDLRPGSKYYYWEIRGVPIRIEIGLKEFMENNITIVRRDTFEKTNVKLKSKNILSIIKDILEDIERNLMKKAEELMKEGIIEVRKKEEIANLDGILRAGWCGKEECGLEIEKLGDFGILGIDVKSKENMNCIICNEKGKV